MNHMKILLLLFSLLATVGANAETLKFTIQQTINPDRSVTPTLTWCTELTATAGTTCGTSGIASACTAAGDWTGTKTGSGSTTLAKVSTSKTYTLSCAWPGSGGSSIALSWTPPTANDDGTPITNLKGYKIYYSTTQSMSTNQIKDITNPGLVRDDLGPLAAGPYYIVMTAYNTDGIESKPSPQLTKTVTSTGGGSTVSQTVKVTFPGIITNFKAE